MTDEKERFAWQALLNAVQREDFNSANYWLSQLLIHRSKLEAGKAVIQW